MEKDTGKNQNMIHNQNFSSILLSTFSQVHLRISYRTKETISNKQIVCSELNVLN